MLNKTQEQITAKWKSLDTEHPLVSIKCLAFNHEKYIAQTLDGFLMQETDFPFEVIINDDASKDKTAAKVSKKMQKLVEDYKNELSAYGISVKSGGYMELSASAVENLSFKTLEKKFGKDSDFMKELSKFEKQLSRHFDAYA